MTTRRDSGTLAFIIILVLCAVVMFGAGWQIVLLGWHGLGLLLIVAALAAAVVAYGEWSWR